MTFTMMTVTQADEQRAVAQQVAAVKRSTGEGTSLPVRLRILLSLGRPRTCVVGTLTFVLGLAYTSTPWSTRAAIGALLCFFGAFVANLANTVTDLEEDCRNLPGRLRLLARYGYTRFWWTLVGMNLLMVATAALLGSYCFWFMLLALLLVNEYSFPPLRAKKRPLVGLWVFSLVVSYPFFMAAFVEPEAPFFRSLVGTVLAMSTGSGVPPAEDPQLRFLAALAFLTVWFVAKGTFKNVPDYDGDRAAGVRTSATVFASQHTAARVATAATLLAYALLGLLVLTRLAPPRLGWALLWTPVVAYNCLRLVRATSPEQGNAALKADMIVSVGFIASWLLLVQPLSSSIGAIVVGMVVIVASDLLQVDSRRDADREQTSD